MSRDVEAKALEFLTAWDKGAGVERTHADHVRWLKEEVVPTVIALRTELNKPVEKMINE